MEELLDLSVTRVHRNIIYGRGYHRSIRNRISSRFGAASICIYLHIHMYVCICLCPLAALLCGLTSAVVMALIVIVIGSAFNGK